jgi:1-deoxy-D-xylulose-5-phosphate reductoisomerase
MKNIIVLGATGSIGENTLDVAARFPDRIRVVALAAHSDAERLEAQARAFQPRVVALADRAAAATLSRNLAGLGIEVLAGPEGVIAAARLSEGDLVVSGIVGAAGLAPTLAAIESKKTVALANKEALVMAGELVMNAARQRGVSILPVDSEHSGLYQLMAGRQGGDIRKVTLTASGGPLLDFSDAQKRVVTPDQATAHPTWKMGPKISVDSATLMNKGLEVIEARWLFDLPPDRIEVLIHRQSIVHAMVEFGDRSVMAQMALPDMRIPIAYALFHPERAPLPLPSLDLTQVGTLTFEPVSPKSFPLLGCAYAALVAGGTAPAVLNAANEVAVGAFLAGQIAFTDVHAVVQKTLDAHIPTPITTLDGALAADQWARRVATKFRDEARVE